MSRDGPGGTYSDDSLDSTNGTQQRMGAHVTYVPSEAEAERVREKLRPLTSDFPTATLSILPSPARHTHRPSGSRSAPAAWSVVAVIPALDDAAVFLECRKLLGE